MSTRPMEQNKEPRNKPLRILLNHLSTKVPRPFTGERTVFSTNELGKTGHPCVKELIWIFTLHHI